MTNQEKKKYLERYGWDKITIAQLEDQIKELRLSALPGGINYDGMPHGSGWTSDLSDYAAKMDALIAKYSRARQKKIDDMREIVEAINEVEMKDKNDGPKLAVLLRYRYIEGIKDWGVIAKRMNHSEDYVKRRLHSLALTSFQIPRKE